MGRVAAKTMEERLAYLETMFAEIHAIVVMGSVPPPSEVEYRRAIDELAFNKNRVPLERYLAKGGTIPREGA